MTTVVSTAGLRGIGAGGGPGLGAWCRLRDDLVAETLAEQGFDWVCIDAQHGLGGSDSLPGMVRAVTGAGVPVVTRVRRNDPGEIMWALDVGSHGVIVPLVNDAEQARAAASASHYPPVGARSRGVIRPSLAHAHPNQLNRDVVCMVMIETREAVAHIEEIVAVDGVDGVFVGPVDLALDFGHETNAAAQEDHRYLAATDRVASACRAAGIVAGIYGGSLELVRFWSDRGYRMIALHSDVGLLEEASAAALAAARSLSH